MPFPKGHQPYNAGKYENLTGKVFGQLTVLEEVARDPAKKPDPRRWLCRCSCGRETTVVGRSIRVGDTKSCGCYRRSWASARPCPTLKHGMWNTSEYHIWHGMKSRCLNPRTPNFALYGGRGIVVCERWKNSFQNFFTDMGPRPSLKHSLDRKDGNGSYSPDNCRWATPVEQQRNRRNNVIISYKGETLQVHVWAERLGVSFHALCQRLDRGWSAERTIEEPIHVKVRRH